MRPMASNGMASSPSPFFPPNFLLQMQQTPPDHDPQEHQHHHEHHHLPPPFHPHHNPYLPSSQCTSLQDFRGMAPMLGKRPMYGGADVGGPGDDANGGCGGANEDELSDDGSQAGEKKRRLNVDQGRTLEKNFELGNKLEPERKLQLARALGLQPRQVAIWFQNRRARWKTKQLEKDYDVLKRQLDAVKADNDALLSQNKRLQAEILALKGREAGSELINLNKETEASCSNRSENSSEINLDISRTPPSSEGPMYRPPHHQQQHPSSGGGGMIPFYPSVGRPSGVDIEQLMHTTSAAPKLEQHSGGGVQGAETASFGNLLCGVDEPPPFWPWADHQHFH